MSDLQNKTNLNCQIEYEYCMEVEERIISHLSKFNTKKHFQKTIIETKCLMNYARHFIIKL